MEVAQLHRDLGRVEGKLEAQGEQLDALFRKFDDYHEQNSAKIDRLLAHHERQRGAARVWGVIAAAVASLFGILAAALCNMFFASGGK